MSDFDLPITSMSPKRHRRAVAQLVNAERTKRGLPPLKFAISLRVSAQAWAVIMTRDTRFDHGDFARRVLRFPFILNGKPRSRTVGENLGMGTGGFSTPRSIVDEWLRSDEHKANMLRPRWKYGAVWSSNDAPDEPGRQRDGVTVVHHFGGGV